MRRRLGALLGVLPPLGANDLLALDFEPRTAEDPFDEAGLEVAVDVAHVPAHHLGIAAVEELGGERRIDEEASTWLRPSVGRTLVALKSTERLRIPCPRCVLGTGRISHDQ